MSLEPTATQQIITDTSNSQSIICPNCGHAMEAHSHFCSNCGQDTHHSKLPFKHFILEFLEGLFHFDTKIWLTLRQLFKSPGLVIRDFNDNKRARYVPPIRLYIFVSVLFFILANSGVKKQASSVDLAIQKDDFKDGFSVSVFGTTSIDSLTSIKLASTPYITDRQVDSILQSANITASTLNKKIIRQIVHLKRKETSAQEMGHTFITAISKILFVLMPLFAFLVWLFAGPRKLFYSETLVFSIYFHSFYFLLMIIAVILSKVVQVPNLYSWIYLIACLYLITSIKFAFRKEWWKAVVLSLALILIYTAIFISVFALALISSIVF